MSFLQQRRGFYSIDSAECHGIGADEMPNLGYKIGPKLGYFPAPFTQSGYSKRDDYNVEQCGLMVERAHHEIAPAQHGSISDSILL